MIPDTAKHPRFFSAQKPILI